MPGRKYTEAQAELAAELREQGMTITQISERTGMGPQSVQYHCLRLGADLPPDMREGRNCRQPELYFRNGNAVRRFTPEEDRQLLELAVKGTPVSEIARRIGRRPNSTKNRLMLLARHEARAEEAQMGGGA